MKLTKKLEAEILKLYHSCWDANLRGDIKTFASYLDDDVTLFGTAAGEVFTSKKEAFKFYKATADQMTGKTDFRKRKISMKATGNSVVLKEECDLYVLAEEKWMFYDHARITAVFEQKEKSWKIVQWHASFPDRRTEEGEQINTDKIKAENVQLRDAVRRRTEELENKNRELEIETALEKVRSVAMGMKEPADMLKICKTISQQLQKLGVKEIRNVQTAIICKEKGTYVNYQYYAKHNKSLTTEVSYIDHPMTRAFIKKMLDGPNEFFKRSLKGNKVKEWYSFQKKSTNQFADKYLLKASSLNYYWYSLGPMALGISTYEPLSKEEQDLVVRFRNVFELSIRRYLDIEKAEAQAREVKVELGLERVRARAMAMQNSDELAELVSVVFKELTKLDFALTSCVIWISDTQTLDNTLWVTSSEMNKPAKPVRLKPFQHSFFHSIIHAWKEKDPKWIYTLTGKEKAGFEKAFFASEPNMPVALKKALSVPKKVVFSASFNNFGALEILGTEPLTDEKFEILHRFGKVFDSSYTRFNDLKKAEAQAREAQIEVAVERVRAKALAMHQSGEIMGVAVTMRKEFESLKIPGFDAATITLRQDDGTIRLWDNTSAKQHEDGTWENTEFIFRLEENHPDFYLNKIWNSNEKYFVVEQNENDLLITTDWVRKFDKNLADIVVHHYKKNGIKHAWHPAVQLTHGRLNLDFYFVAPEPEVETILLKMGAAFDLAYKRFLDLQKAEAQTREAQIEVAVERVRAKALAMHKSEDLHSVVVTLKKELRGLQIPNVTAATIYLNQDDGTIRILDLSNADNEDEGQPELAINKVFRIEEIHPKLWINRMWKRKENYFVEEADEADFKRVIDWLYSIDKAEGKIAEKIIREKKIKKAWLPTIKLEKGILNIDMLQPPAPEIESILSKIGAGFDLAYKRFLDLKKAESQAREAQIQLSLERVRAKAMAMYHSDELNEVLSVLFEQFDALGINPVFAHLSLFDLEKNLTTLRITGKGGKRSMAQKTVAIDAMDEWKEELANWKASKPSSISRIYYPKKIVPQIWELFGDLFDQLPADSKISPADFPNGLYCIQGNTGYGYIGLNHTRDATEEEKDIIHRFATEFGRVYQRFLDLQKAEAQAREAQIQLALERVRARTMAMHHSHELTDVVKLLYQEFDKLKISNESTDIEIGIIDEETGIGDVWAHLYLSDGTISTFKFPFNHFPKVRDEFKKWKSTPPEKRNELFFTSDFSGKVWKEFIKQSELLPELAELFRPLIEAKIDKWVTHNAYFSHGILTLQGTEHYADETLEIQKRFAKVFEQTYTRFLDLKKAEAQAREAEIELALERVRAKTMAMQKSEELQEVVHTLVEKLKDLDVEFYTAIIILFTEGSKDITWWLENKERQQYSRIVVPYADISYLRDLFDTRDNAESHFSKTYSFREKNELFHHLFSTTGFRHVPEKQRKFLLECEAATMSVALAKNTGIHLTRYTDKTFSEADNEILRRFAKIFEQSYTRFLDLQKAEAQAREAQIEAALERIRSRSLAMHHSSELSTVVDTLLQEFTKLEFSLTFCIINLINGDDRSNTVWAANPETGKDAESYYMKFEDYDFHRAMWNAWKEQDKRFVYTLEGEEKRKYDEYLYSETEFRRFPKHVQEANKALERYVAGFTFFKYSGLQTVSVNEITEAELEILERFGRVFEQAYTRFLDLQKAEAQAREAKIEAALERVRSRSMGMQKSDELKEVIKIVYEQFVHLNINIEHTGFVVDYKPKDDWHFWIADKNVIPSKITHRYFESIWANQFIEAKEKGKDFFATHLSFEEKNKFYRELLKDVPELTEDVREFYFNCPGLAVSTVLLDNVALYIENFSGIPYTEEENAILMRFGKVFQQTYTRFLDLQKAEAQARESQIETALEKVRSTSLAMHRSEELEHVVVSLFDRLVELGLNFHGAGIYLFEKEKRNMFLWVASRVTNPVKVNLPYDAEIEYNSINQDLWRLTEEDKDVLNKCYTGPEKDDYYRYVGKYNDSLIPEPVRMMMIEAESWTASFAVEKNCALLIDSWERGLTSNEDFKIVKRFARVFEQAYTRFLDLQKAEAQAREAQIETGLERVRSKTMAMHKSEEVTGIAVSLNEELLKLGFTGGSTILIIDEETGDTEQWTGFSEDKSIESCYVPYFKHPYHDTLLSTWKNGDKFLVYTVAGKEKKPLDDHYFSTGYKIFPEKDKQWMRAMESVTFSHAFMKYGAIHWGPTHLTEEQLRILQRFANVFEQSYTRFLDLKKAEAQAREAQIEAALEKVRSRSLAMHKSNELQEVITILFDRFSELNIEAATASILIVNDHYSFTETWIQNAERTYSSAVHIPHYKQSIISCDFENALTNKVDLLSKLYSQEEKNEWFSLLFRDTELSKIPEERKKYVLNGEAYCVSFAHTKHGGIYLGRYMNKPFTNEENNILKRFANVFEQAYIRFLDLQKAEAQAREAQIEAALERVRSRAMAMQKSDELHEVAALLFRQVSDLGIKTWTTGFNVWSDDNNYYTDYITNPQGGFIEPYTIDVTKSVVFTKMSEAKKRGDDFLVTYHEGDELVETYRQLMKAGDKQFKALLDNGFSFPTSQYEHVVFGSRISLLFITYVPVPEAHDIFKRFGKVFEQTYTRFLDLQKAEAQARESQIELGLERVRARAMAMQHSDELKELIRTVSFELGKLDIILDRSFIIIYDLKTMGSTWWMANPETPSEPIGLFIKYHEYPPYLAHIDAWKNRKVKWEYILEGDVKKEWDEFLFVKTGLSQLPGPVIDNMRSQKKVYLSSSFNNFGYLSLATLEPLTDEQSDIMLRFAKVFDLTYTRFNDLKQAEAQAHEARIEISLERIRARALAMHKSDELKEVAKVLWEQMNLLGQREMEAAAVHLYELDPNYIHSWRAVSIGPDANIELTFGHMAIPKNTCQLTREWLEGFYSDANEYTIELSGAKQDEWYELLFRLAPDVANSMHLKGDMHEKRYYRFSKFSGGALLMISKQEPSEEVAYLQRRAAVVFDLAYRRFTDLQKAEAQAREAQIEASLERVRAKAMAMHKSEDLNSAVAVVFEELDKLNIGVLRCGISILNKEKRTGDIWVTSITDQGSAVHVSGDESFDIHPLLQGAFEAWLRREDFSYLLEGDDLVQYYKAVKDANFQLPESQLLTSEKEYNKQYCFTTTYGAGGLFAFRETEFPEEAKTVMRRFASVFDLTYKRFLDLQRAEANAREAQIEAALERVRSKTMAMHNSQDVADTVSTMFDEVVKLGVETVRCGIAIIDESKTMEVWTASSKEDGTVKLIIGQLDMSSHPLFMNVFDAWKNKESITTYELVGEDLKDYFRNINNSPDYPIRYEIESLPYSQSNTAFMFPEGSLFVFSKEPLVTETTQIFKRFAGVFGQTYRRYLDLQRAEAQTRQAQIETAMEKVRARALAMQKPEELVEVAEVLRKEMGLLGVEELETSSIYIHDETLGKTECWYAIKKIKDEETKLVTDHMIINLQDTWVGRQMLEFYNSDKLQISIPMQGENRKEWINYCSKKSSVLGGFYGETIPDRTYHLNKFSNGFIGAASPGDISSESWELLQRATSVFSLAYTRFSDLQIAEASAREAVRRASLDRVRAEIASMRTTNDLQRITPLIWNELTILNIPFIRCGVFIMDESQQFIHTFLSTPDGKAIGAFHLPYDTPGNIRHVLSNWRNKTIYTDHWSETEFHQFAEILVQQGALESAENYLKTIPHGGFHLHFLPFLQGMLYVGNTDKLNDEQIELIQHVADAFSTAYARYEDFNKLEAAKQQVERTLTDLKQAQTQLVQSEKMASLGELTAGIAHEIQNPLNFVNNFSDVSSELLDEMIDELSKGNVDSVKEIVEDVKQNLEKINHHGKRADGIVKGMLQHSRTSSGQKELTDINALADEYLRLAFHGLRAKDKSFNAKFETDFDPSIDKVEVTPQDIGRVILNLINNAFYAVSEKKKQNTNGFEPTVIVTTKKVENTIEVRVKDNGTGIPQKVIDKIFQPFFTTKPTGQGTGLGLSLSYDIIKTHGGDLKVETREGEGSEFIILLPA